jgi:hypothetical protein
MTFTLHPNFRKKHHLIDLPLCKVFLEDECLYPWILLIPQRPNITKIIDLSFEDQILFHKEGSLAQKIIWDLFKPDQLNVAAIGNKTPQLHLHIIGRYQNDPAWPGTVWDHPIRKKYTESEIKQTEYNLKQAFYQAVQI